MTQVQDASGTAVPGLPELLPRGEKILWQGAPDWRDLALHGFHLRKLAIYFVLLLVARVVVQGNAGATAADIAGSTALLAALAAVTLGFIAFYAWLAARAARYMVTNRRVIIRCGATLPMTINLPFDKLVSADLRVRPDGHGDLPVTLADDSRPSRVILWPHVKPWSLLRVKPMLRSLPDAQQAGTVLGEALHAYADGSKARQSAPRIVRDEPTAMPANLSTSAG